MGRQGGIARFLGTVGWINGYVDDGKPIWRRKSSLDKKRWRSLRTMRRQRECATLFSSASVIAGGLWSALPKGMRRLADGGAFNRLVGQCRLLIDEEGQMADLDGLRRLNLSADSMGPHRVFGSVGDGFRRRRAVDGHVAGIGTGSGCLKFRRRRAVDSPVAGRHGLDLGHGLRVVGMGALDDFLHASSGVPAGGPSQKFVVANRFINDGVTRETVDWPKLGFITDRWRNGGKGYCGNGEAASELRAVRRYRVWVHVAEVVSTSLSPRDKVYELAEGQRMHASGFVTDWVQNMGHPSECLEPGWTGWNNMKLDLRGLLDGIEDGTFVLFTAIEVAEKRGRHWVRLPWCCRMEVSGVIEVEPTPVVGRGAWDEGRGCSVGAFDHGFGALRFGDFGLGARGVVAPLDLVSMDLGP